MAPSVQASGRYESVHADPSGPGDTRPTAQQIVHDQGLVGALRDKAILLTGGGNGIGVEEVRALALTGADVTFTSRNIDRDSKVKADILKAWNEPAVTPKLSILEMDLQSLDSVRRAAEEFKKHHDRLHILIANAGIGLVAHGLTKDGFEQHFGVNHLSHFYLVKLLKPLLLKSSTPDFNSRITVVASSIHAMGSVKVGDYNLEQCGYDPFAAYANSKTANIWMSNELERRYGSRGLHSISVHPGGIETGLQAKHDDAAAKMIAAALQQEHIKKAMKSAEQGAASVVLAAIGQEYEGVGGFYMEDCDVSLPFPEGAPLGTPGYKPWAYDEEGERQLWVDSLRMLNLDDDEE